MHATCSEKTLTYFYIFDTPLSTFSIPWARHPRHSSYTPLCRPRLCDFQACGNPRTMPELYCFPSGGQVISFFFSCTPFASHNRRFFRIVRYVHIYDCSATKSNRKGAEDSQDKLIAFQTSCGPRWDTMVVNVAYTRARQAISTFIKI